ncbi:MAG: hypothetical protein IIA45_12055, partial [Bacteroidetes bacterium]|nr:hypothetical protein [Bacteroidota bacterium]
MISRLSARTSALILLTFLLDCTFSHAQCVAEAGNDTALCASFELDTFYLGGSPTVSGGAPPYTFDWSCTYYFGPLTFTASDFLDDTTLANPQLLQPADSLITFHLVVTDNLGNICQDTVSIRFSFWLWTLDDKIAGIH